TGRPPQQASRRTAPPRPSARVRCRLPRAHRRPIHSLATVSRFRPGGKVKLIEFVLSDFRWRLGGPRGNGLLLRWVQRFHRLPRDVDALGKEIADQQVGDDSLEIGEVLDELSEAEAI